MSTKDETTPSNNPAITVTKATGSQRPTVGRIVLFQESRHRLAAIVVKVNDDDTINLHVYEQETARCLFKSHVPHGPGEQEWEWPPRV